MKRAFFAFLVALFAALGRAEGQAVTEFQAIAPDGHIMAGEIVTPQRGFSAAVMLISGSGRQSREFADFEGRYAPHRDWLDTFLQAGLAVIRFDERGTGGSGGDHREATLSDLVDDAETVLRAARMSLGGADLFVLGHSEGAVIAMTLSARGEDLTGLILLGAPSKSPRDFLRDQAAGNVERTADMSEADRAAARDAWYQGVIARFEQSPVLRDHLDVDVPALAAAVDAPVFVIEGGADELIAPPQGEELAALIAADGSPDVWHRRYTNVNHFMTPQPEGMTGWQAIEDFTLDARIRADAAAWILERAGQ
ncbi:alpha/beta fold hydrolase [Marinicauda algicola]|uniref:Alpha/beta fold hydrolase n=1 Tax=Marinicauda algicola TaxID=2029849 RepID=A0A4V3RXY1_9PROT|nr:alpha/beta fold hydrolase [Marinicauda algicola]TGY88309.1 alpha/beta fold hydrolase [Marinicauda algicola]